jgi:hypothetical protein
LIALWSQFSLLQLHDQRDLRICNQKQSIVFENAGLFLLQHFLIFHIMLNVHILDQYSTGMVVHRNLYECLHHGPLLRHLDVCSIITLSFLFGLQIFELMFLYSSVLCLFLELIIAGCSRLFFSVGS